MDFVSFVSLDWSLLVGHLGLRSSCFCLLLCIKIESLWGHVAGFDAILDVCTFSFRNTTTGP